ncbi:MAG: hypothetical protein U0R80_05370 [Nocardioidaceae bacterium]
MGAPVAGVDRSTVLAPQIDALAGGAFFTLALAADGRVYGTGLNSLGELTGRRPLARGLIMLKGLPVGVRATAVAGGYGDALTVGDDGVAYGAGLNGNGQITGKRYTWYRLHPLTGLPDGVRATAVAAGTYHSLVLGDDGVAYGAGDNWSGQLTGPPSNHVRTLVPLTGLPEGVSATAVAAGNAFSLVLGDDGVAYGTGSNTWGQLTGDEPTLRTLTPLAGLPEGVSARAIGASPQHSLVVGSDGTAYGAGHNQVAQLTGTDSPRTSLRPLAGLPGSVRAVGVAPGSKHTLVLGDDGTVYGTGSNADGQLTRQVEFRLTLTPLRRVEVGVSAVDIAAGYRHSVVLGSDGRAYGTGANGAGQISGDLDGIDFFLPMEWGFASLTRPVVVGPPRLGFRLTVQQGRWWPVPVTFAYRWYRDGQPIPGAVTRTHLLVRADLGARLMVKVTAKAPGVRPGMRLTARVGPVRR